MRPKPSADWVKSALERLNIRVVYDRPGRPFLGASQGNRSSDRERQKKAQHKQQQSFSSPSAPPLGESLRDDGIRSGVGGGGGGIARDPYGGDRAVSASATAAHAYGTNPGRGSTMQQSDISQAAGYFGAGPGANMRRTIDERSPGAPVPNPTAGDIIEGRYPYNASSYMYPKNDAMTAAMRGNDSSKIKSPGRMENTNNRYPDDTEDAQSYDSRHYDMLKNHHMNLLRELEETTVLMNAIRRKQEHRQQQQQQEPQPQPPYAQAQSAMVNPSPYASSYPREMQSQLANLSNLHPTLPQRPNLGSSPMRIPPSYSNLPTDSLLAALGPRQQLPPYPSAGQRFDEGLEAAILNRQQQRINDRLGTDHLSRPLDRSNYNDLMSPGGRLGQAGPTLLQNVIERRLSNEIERRLSNPLERQGRLDYLSPMHPTRDRQDPNYRHYNTAGVDPMAQQDTGVNTATAAEQHDFSDSLFAANMDSSASGSRRQSDASRSSYQPFPQQDQDQRLQPATRTSSLQERQNIQRQQQEPDEEPLLCTEEVKTAVDEKAEHGKNRSASAISQAASEDLNAATSLKDFQRQSSSEHSAGTKRDSSWLQKADETKEYTTMNKASVEDTTQQSSEPSRKRHNLEIPSPPNVPDGTGSRPSSKQASSSNKQEGEVPEGGKVAEC